jgi:flagellar hook-basal body complex protein FliE
MATPEMEMSVGGINTNQIDSMLAMLRNMSAQASPSTSVGNGITPIADVSTGATTGNSSVAKVSFADALKSSLGEVNKVQEQAQQMGNQFAAGNDNISISDVMIATQKANISLQATVQVRNKMVAAYTDIMNMQI